MSLAIQFPKTFQTEKKKLNTKLRWTALLFCTDEVLFKQFDRMWASIRMPDMWASKRNNKVEHRKYETRKLSALFAYIFFNEKETTATMTTTMTMKMKMVWLDAVNQLIWNGNRLKFCLCLAACITKLLLFGNAMPEVLHVE